MQARYLYSELSKAIQARNNCIRKANKEWFERWTNYIDALVNLMPSGSGIDSGTQIDLDASHAEKLVFTTSFHHMNDGGFYDGWTDHTVTVTPSFASSVNVRISGRNRNDIKDHLSDTYHHALMQIVNIAV